MIVDSGLHPPVVWGIPEQVSYLHRRIRDYYALEHGRRVELTVDDVMREMDEAGVDVGILLTQATGGRGFDVSNDKVWGVVQTHPDRFAAMCSVDPTRGRQAVDEFEKAVQQGFKALVLYPQYCHFYINDERVFPLYEKAVELDVPVVFIPYWSTPASSIKYADPSLVDDVAVKYRKLNIVIQGLGGGLFWEAYVVGCKNPNVYFTTSACTFIYPDGVFEEYLNVIRDSWIAMERVMFASEYPLSAAKEYRRIVDSLGLSLDDRRAILGGTAARLFKLQ